MMKQFTAKAKILDSGKEIEGGVCEFENPKTGEKTTFMLHKNEQGMVTVSKIDPKTICGVFNCWEWMDKWLKVYEQDHPNFRFDKFKEWINQQPMCAE